MGLTIDSEFGLDDHPVTLTGNLNTDEWLNGHDEAEIVLKVAERLDISCRNDSESGQMFVYFRDVTDAEVVKAHVEELIARQKMSLLELADELV